MGKNGRTLFDRPKPTVSCSASGIIVIIIIIIIIIIMRGFPFFTRCDIHSLEAQVDRFRDHRFQRRCILEECSINLLFVACCDPIKSCQNEISKRH